MKRSSFSHEMYDAGHLLEAALAHRIYSEDLSRFCSNYPTDFTTAGSTRLLSPILKYIKHIHSVFGLEAGQKAG
jgi:hypothetical protein